MQRQGWICPRCDKVLSPDVKGCECARLPDLIGKPLPSFPKPDQVGVWPTYPMPVCGCTGPCMNAACPHRLVATCINTSVIGDGLTRTNGVG